MDILKICGLGVLCALVGIILRHIKGEFAPLVRVCGMVLIFGMAIIAASDIFSELEALLLGDAVSGYAVLMLKALGIALISKISADICRDSGEGAIGSGVELGGKLVILSMCIPLIKELTGYAIELLEME